MAAELKRNNSKECRANPKQIPHPRMEDRRGAELCRSQDSGGVAAPDGHRNVGIRLYTGGVGSRPADAAGIACRYCCEQGSLQHQRHRPHRIGDCAGCRSRLRVEDMGDGGRWSVPTVPAIMIASGGFTAVSGLCAIGLVFSAGAVNDAFLTAWSAKARLTVRPRYSHFCGGSPGSSASQRPAWR